MNGLLAKITDFFAGSGISEGAAVVLASIVIAIAAALCCIIAYFVSKKPLFGLISAAVGKSRGKWLSRLYERGVFDRLVLLVPALALYFLSPAFGPAAAFVRGAAGCAAILALLFAFGRMLDAANDIYSTYEMSRLRPIKGYLQVLKILSYIIAAVLGVSALLDKSPGWILGGIGAATAVLMLIFQNTILGFVASIQLTENDMLHIGDWIEMPSRGADGFVIDISLHTVKVQNWDKSITTVPTYALMSESFRNWRGMWETGARRIKRAINIDIRSVRFVDEDLADELFKLPYVEGYLESEQQPTNLGALRTYLAGYLKDSPDIRGDMLIKVRLLEPTEYGIPLEIYAFAATTQFDKYEDIQSKLFEHIIAVIPRFGLRVYQSISGSDLAGGENLFGKGGK